MAWRELLPDKVRFGPYHFDVESGRLATDGMIVTLRPKTALLLTALLRRAPDHVSRDMLMETVWPDTHVADTSLARLINELRQALSEEPTAIETLPKRGYRFTLDVAADSMSRGSGDADQTASVEKSWHTPKNLWVVFSALATVGLAVALISNRERSFPENLPLDADERKHLALSEYRDGFRSWGLWSLESMNVALVHFRRACLARPDLWHGFVGVAQSHLAWNLLAGEADPVRFEQARQAAQRAVRLAPEVAATHSLKGRVALIADWDWVRAETEFDQALSLNAFSYGAYQSRGILRMLQGRFAEAHADFNRSLELQPEHSDAVVFLAANELYAGKYKRVLQLLHDLPDNSGKRRQALRIKACAYGLSGRFPEARRALESAGLPAIDRYALAAWIEARAGDHGAAMQSLASLEAACQEEDRVWCDATAIYVALGREDKAFAGLMEGLRLRHWKLLLLAIDPRLKPLHSNPRWKTVVATLQVPRHALPKGVAEPMRAVPPQPTR